ncbi:MAG TPA: hypothetical protein VFI34_05630, partial [Candidatus Limnocylindrales bacterium]|nr:hypothetical protein [Candidatus Limnocylindrales bacterium]
MDDGFELRINPNLDDDAHWPATRASRAAPRVIAPIFGAYHAARHRLDAAAREHGLDATESLVLVAIRLEGR